MYNEKRIAHTLKQLFDNTLKGCIFARKLYPSYFGSKPRETFVVECIMLEYYLAGMKG